MHEMSLLARRTVAAGSSRTNRVSSEAADVSRHSASLANALRTGS
jgi:hypothetical protein